VDDARFEREDVLLESQQHLRAGLAADPRSIRDGPKKDGSAIAQPSVIESPMKTISIFRLDSISCRSSAR
jgi:hypothetical protein